MVILKSTEMISSYQGKCLVIKTSLHNVYKSNLKKIKSLWLFSHQNLCGSSLQTMGRFVRAVGGSHKMVFVQAELEHV